jgi:hypothetical protein
MVMKALVLTEKSVSVMGHSLLGIPADPLVFVRADHSSLEWERRTFGRVDFRKRLRQVSLEAPNGKTFPVFEHVGPLAAIGLRGVTMKTGRVVPHISRTSDVWNALKPHVQPSDFELTPVTPRETLRYFCGSDRYIEFGPTNDGLLTIQVEVSYPDILNGRYYWDQYVFPDTALLERVFAARTLGLLRPPFQFLEPLVSRATFFPVVRDAVWKRMYERYEQRALLREICDHRVQDILGALSLATHGRHYPCGKIRSHKGGHDCDLPLVRELRRPGMLVPL